MEQARKYEQLRPEDRVAIASLRLQGKGVRETAQAIGRSPSTVSRELRRNGAVEAGYSSQQAMVLHAMRRRAARRPRKLCPSSVNWSVVTTLLHWRWSPEQIAATLKRVFPGQSERHVSHETIYTTIYVTGRPRTAPVCRRASPRGSRSVSSRSFHPRSLMPCGCVVWRRSAPAAPASSFTCCRCSAPCLRSRSSGSDSRPTMRSVRRSCSAASC
jgi:IS30 family transposase